MDPHDLAVDEMRGCDAAVVQVFDGTPDGVDRTLEKLLLVREFLIPSGPLRHEQSLASFAFVRKGQAR
ncbi:MAG TPA: hypothetical protein VLS89_16895, partial [Candidatus Nanopelagicales bacterium]|nr:hypothetical protein [Candidatus Nanopelagicales bacterium]